MRQRLHFGDAEIPLGTRLLAISIKGAEASTPATLPIILAKVCAARPGPQPTSRCALAFASSGRRNTLS